MIPFTTATFSDISCVFSNYQAAFCGKCNCTEVCKNNKSANILKCTLLIRELELMDQNDFDFQVKLDLYSPIIKKLCQCS